MERALCWLLACGASSLVTGCRDQIYLGELPTQPSEAGLGKWVALEASSGEAAQVRLRVDGGRARKPNADERTAEPLCWDLIDGELDTVVNILPANVEASVTAELVGAGECSAAISAGRTVVLVVRSAAPPADGGGGSGGAPGDQGGANADGGAGGGGT